MGRVITALCLSVWLLYNTYQLIMYHHLLHWLLPLSAQPNKQHIPQSCCCLTHDASSFLSSCSFFYLAVCFALFNSSSSGVGKLSPRVSLFLTMVKSFVFSQLAESTQDGLEFMKRKYSLTLITDILIVIFAVCLYLSVLS